MAKRSVRAQVAQETIRIIEHGQYTSPAGQTVAIRADLDAACSRSVLYTPTDFDDVFHQRDHLLRDRRGTQATLFEVRNETTLNAARRLVQGDGELRVLALNFASARNPGGGFLGGSQAQEESLARASGLYACLGRFLQMYDINRQFLSCLYTDHMIYAPEVPVFRDDEDALLESPYRLTFLTAPAVNAGAVRSNEPENVPQIEPVMRARMEKVLALAFLHGHDVLVLGAWGCGVFGNNPKDVAYWFADLLLGHSLYRSAFRRVIFAVLDHSPKQEIIRPFEERFGKAE